MWWWGAPGPPGTVAPPAEAAEDKPLPWTPCPDCGAPMIDDEGSSWPYCPICIDEEYLW